MGVGFGEKVTKRYEGVDETLRNQAVLVTIYWVGQKKLKRYEAQRPKKPLDFKPGMDFSQFIVENKNTLIGYAGAAVSNNNTFCISEFFEFFTQIISPCQILLR